MLDSLHRPIDERRREFPEKFVTFNLVIRPVGAPRAGLKLGGVPALFVRPCGGVVVERNGTAGNSQRMVNDVWISVVACRCRIEDHATVEDGYDRFLAGFHVIVPELQLAAEFLFPVLVQVDQDIDAPLEIHGFVVVEIRVNGKMAAILDLVEAGAHEVGVGYKAIYSRHVFQKPNEWLGIERVEEAAKHAVQMIRVKARFEPFLGAVKDHAFLVQNLWKTLEADFQDFRGQEIINYDMRVGIGAVILCSELKPPHFRRFCIEKATLAVAHSEVAHGV